MIVAEPEIKPLVMENATAYIDPETHLIVYTYRNVLSEVETIASFNWIQSHLYIGSDNVRGTIFDFRDVKTFALGETVVAKEKNEDSNNIDGIHLIPVTYIVTNVKQEIKIRMSRMIGSNAPRRTVVHSQEQSLEFINEWNIANNRHFDIPDHLLQTWPNLNLQPITES
ncbi:MAG: hypothetical protein AAF902_15825 [Chloroflexota bacterium]